MPRYEKQPRTVIIIQARMSSSRLPGKIMLPIVGKPLLALLLERIKRCRRVDDCVLATTINPLDDILNEAAQAHSIPVFRGSEEDVLGRFADAARLHHADVVVRVTADCPLIDPAVIDTVIEKYFENNADYASNTLIRTYPRGMDTEVFSAHILQTADREALLPFMREHVTPFIYQHPQRFKLFNVESPQPSAQWRLCVDTLEDYQLIKQIFDAIYAKNPHFNLNDILELLNSHPDWAQINAAVKQKIVS